MYARPRPGEWVKPKRDGYRLECCDCSLVHRADFIVVSGLGLVGTLLLNLLRPRAMFRMFRDEPATHERRNLRESACPMNEF